MPTILNSGLPGIRAARTANHRIVFLQAGPLVNFAGGRIIDGTKTRDVTNTSAIDRLQAGLVMGKITSGGKYSNSIIALTQGALTGTGTTLTTSAAIATEIVRRIGSTGTFKLTGPPTAAGTVRTATVTFSAVNVSSGDVTITAVGVNEVQTVTFAIASTGGSVALMLWDPRTSQYLQVPAAAWSATDATYLSNIQAKLDLAFGAANIVVVSAQSATDTDSALVFTYSGTAVAGVPVVDGSGTAKLPIVTTLPTSSTSYATARTTAGVNGAFVTNSLIQPTDGSETPLLMLPDGYPIPVTNEDGTSEDQPFPVMPVEAIIDSSQIVNWPADASLRTWLAQALSTAMGGKFVFDHVF